VLVPRQNRRATVVSSNSMGPRPTKNAKRSCKSTWHACGVWASRSRWPVGIGTGASCVDSVYVPDANIYYTPLCDMSSARAATLRLLLPRFFFPQPAVAKVSSERSCATREACERRLRHAGRMPSDGSISSSVLLLSCSTAQLGSHGHRVLDGQVSCERWVGLCL